MCDKHEKEETHQMRLLLLVVAWHYQLVYLLAERSPQERDDLRAGAVIARRKRCLAHARGHHATDSYAHSGTSVNGRWSIHAPVKPLPCA